MLFEKLNSGEPVLGTWSIVANATLAEIVGAAGLDFIIMDLEHGAYDFGSLEQAIRAAEGTGTAPLVRVPDLTPSTFQRVLDLGAHGVVVPQIRTVEDARRAVRYARYAPDGVRGYNPFTRVARYAAPAAAGTDKLDPDFVRVGLIIENKDAFEALEEICAIPHVSFIYLGVYDMSLALDCSGDVNHPRVQTFVEQACAIARRAGKTIGMMVKNEAEVEAALELGARMLVWGVDANVLYKAYNAPVERLKSRHAGPDGY